MLSEKELGGNIMTKGKLVDYLKQWPDETEIYLDADGPDELISLDTPTHVQDGDFEALIFYRDEDAKKTIKKWVAQE
jgi:hypothetical protein